MAWPVRSLLALISLPIFTFCAFTLYYYHVKDREWKKYLQNIQKEEIEVAVPLECIGQLIGRGGETIRELQEKTQTRIKQKNEGEKNDKVRIFKIFGNKENVQLAKSLVLDIVDPKDVETLEMWVSEHACGRIIGRCGDNIRSITSSSNANVIVEKSKSRNAKVLVTIKGKANEIAIAKNLIEEKVRESEKCHPPRSPRSRPRNYKGNGVVPHEKPQCEKLIPATTDGMIQVYVSSVASPSNFWLQLISPRGVELDHLVDDMTEYYCKPENQNLHKLTEVKKGQIVASKFEHDEKWYRVEVFSVELNEENPDESQVDVFYLDYGDSCFYRLSDLLELKSEFLHLKFQAIEVSMNGILPKNEKWDEEAIEVFSDMVYSAQWKALLAQVVRYAEKENTTHKEPIPFVRLYDPDGPPGVDIGSQFIEKGYAVRDETVEAEAKEEDDDEATEIWTV